MEYGEAKNDIRELLYIAQKPLLDLAEKVEIVLALKVFPNAGAAREWALERALSGAAPTEWKINLAKTYFCKAGSPGEFCFGPHLFVRGNVVVGYGSDIVPVVSERVDTSLQKLIPLYNISQQAGAGYPPQGVGSPDP
ncbi:MAG: hypothetical protein RBS09_08820 [Anaerolineaceae bacterium]|jgi:hypothetical protein|nr:hypothetical protein [Anaerolineaceae bacterium]